MQDRREEQERQVPHALHNPEYQRKTESLEAEFEDFHLCVCEIIDEGKDKY